MRNPYELADQKESEWDRKCATAPRCNSCGGSIYPYDTYLELDGVIYCEKCVNLNTHSIDNLGVPD